EVLAEVTGQIETWNKSNDSLNRMFMKNWEAKVKHLKNFDWKALKQELEFLQQRRQQMDAAYELELRTLLINGKADGLECYRVQSVSSIIRTPFEKPPDGVLSEKVEVIATPGEYEPASVVLFSKEGLSDLMLEPGDLVSESASIDSGHVDVRVVKCWYQAGTAWVRQHQLRSVRMLVPELLLKDDSLVKVDYKNRINYVRFDFEDGPRYINMSRLDPHEDATTSKLDPKDRQPDWLVKNSPIRDSKTLKPFELPAGQYKQIWFTFYVPKKTAPGLYKGSVKITSAGRLIKTLEVNLRVLPFTLADSRTYYNLKKPFTSGIYYKGILCSKKNLSNNSLRGYWKSEKLFRADLENMLTHGVNNPQIYQFDFDKSLETFEQLLKIRQEVGMDNSKLYIHAQSNWGLKTNDDPKAIAKAVREIKAAKQVAKKYGCKEFYVYAIDEARGDMVTKQRNIWDAFQKQAGVKIYVAGSMHHKPTSFELSGDILDLLVNVAMPKREFADLWHSEGHDIWCYGNPQGGIENPLAFRRNFGLLLWKAKFDGACTYCYSLGYGHPWNDFDSPRWRDHNFTYPTVEGVVDTIAWEGYREAMDDIRYGTTLKQLIAEALSGSAMDAEKKSIAKEADAWLEDIDENTRNLDTVRMKIIQYILKLRR
ncbi:MAG: hypothetical protein KAI94_14825, partial [Anaerolineales bacterium]|nr:hypothetical protein [Anaerolineales bacterium]